MEALRLIYSRHDEGLKQCEEDLDLVNLWNKPFNGLTRLVKHHAFRFCIHLNFYRDYAINS